MNAVLLTLFLIGIIIFLILLIVGRRKIIRHSGFVAVFFLFYFVDNLTIALTNHFPELQFVPNHVWNEFLVCGWSGKLYSILITLSLLYIFRSLLSLNEVGITLHQGKGSFIPSVGIIMAIGFWSYFTGSRSPQGNFDIATLTYLSVLPGLNEELVYRGVLPVCLGRLFPNNWSLASTKVGWSIIITTILFGLLHGLWVDDHFKVHIEIIWVRNAFISGFIFAWLRERTGSLFMPIVAHGVWDFFLFLPRMI